MAIPRVSDLQFLTFLARSSTTMIAASALSVLGALGFSVWAGPYIEQQATSPFLAMTLVTLQIGFALFAGYLVGMAVAAALFGAGWVSESLVPRVILKPSDPDSLARRISDKTGSFWGLCAAAAIAFVVGGHFAGQKMLFNFPDRGLVLTEFRSDSSAAKLRGLRGIVDHSLDQRVAGDVLFLRIGELLGDDDAAVRARAAWAVGRLGLVSLERPLLSALDDEHSLVRQRAAIALGRIRSVDTASALADLLDRSLQTLQAVPDDSDTLDELEAAIVGLGISRRAHSGRVVSERLTEIPEEHQTLALWSIGEAGALCAHDELIARASDPAQPREIRCAAADALKKVSTDADVDALESLFESSDDFHCAQVLWQDWTTDRFGADVVLIVVDSERFHEKLLDSLFNIAHVGLRQWLREVVNNEDNLRLDRLHARELHDYLDDGPPRPVRQRPESCVSDDGSAPGALEQEATEPTMPIVVDEPGAADPGAEETAQPDGSTN